MAPSPARPRDVSAYGERIGISWDSDALLCGKTSVQDPYNEDSFDFFLRFDFSPWPELFPLVYDASKLMPPVADHHVNTNHSLCLETDAAQRLLIKNGEVGTLCRFHDCILLPYLAKQYDLINGDRDAFAGRERPHGGQGIISFYQQATGLQEIQILSILGWMNDGKARSILFNRSRPMDTCICGSRLSSSRCALWHSYLIYTVGKAQMSKDYLQIMKSVPYRPLPQDR